ncbi:MAG: DinB family protein [Bryobacteraceae bacterium]
MKAALLALILTLSASAESSFDDADRKALLEHLDRTNKVFNEAIRGLSSEQAKFRTAPNRWSVLEIAEHLTLAEEFLFTRAAAGLKKEVNGKSPASDANVLEGWGTRTQKVTAPPNLEPSGRWANLAAVQKEFDARRARTREFVASTHADLRGHLCCGGMEVYQQLLGLSAHVLRHVDQMKEVMADPNFPKK